MDDRAPRPIETRRGKVVQKEREHKISNVVSQKRYDHCSMIGRDMEDGKNRCAWVQGGTHLYCTVLWGTWGRYCYDKSQMDRSNNGAGVCASGVFKEPTRGAKWWTVRKKGRGRKGKLGKTQVQWISCQMEQF